MNDVYPGWLMTLEPFYYLTGKLLSILAIAMLLWFIGLKVFKVEKEKYQGPMNIANLIFCILSSVLLAYYIFELILIVCSGPINEQKEFLNRAIGPYGILFLVLMWVPLLLTQLLWRKKNRMNINLALFIIFMFNIHLWLEWIYIVITTLLRN